MSKPRGRKPDEQRLLDAAREAEVRELIRRHVQDELGLPFALWSRAAVGALIARRCGVELAVRTVGKYLARWGFTAQEPIRRAWEQDPAAVRRWLRRDYPAIVAQAKRARGVVVWGDETGLRSDDVRGRCCAPRGRTPLVRVCRRRAGLSLITAVTNRGKLRWMVVDGAVNAPTFIRFLRRLIRDARQKVFLILDRLQAHRARLSRAWLAAHRSEIGVHYLPLGPSGASARGAAGRTMTSRDTDSDPASRTMCPNRATVLGPGSRSRAAGSAKDAAHRRGRPPHHAPAKYTLGGFTGPDGTIGVTGNAEI